jgi:hypothetical protein
MVATVLSALARMSGPTAPLPVFTHQVPHRPIGTLPRLHRGVKGPATTIRQAMRRGGKSVRISNPGKHLNASAFRARPYSLALAA